MASGDDGGGGGAQDDFFDQMLSTHPSAWGDLGASENSLWEIVVGAEDLDAFDELALLASRLRQHQISGENPVMLQLTDLQRQGLGSEESGGRGFSPLPLFTDWSPPQSWEEKDGGFNEEEAKKKIYNVSCERYFGFGCEIDEETSNKLEGIPESLQHISTITLLQVMEAHGCKKVL
ncbi:hypothetical protein ZWY2020_005973 [Hordeum vulgare]|nr:hypothetical protein ZWY2020_005973 [Hordeum vulgare]